MWCHHGELSCVVRNPTSSTLAAGLPGTLLSRLNTHLIKGIELVNSHIHQAAGRAGRLAPEKPRVDLRKLLWRTKVDGDTPCRLEPAANPEEYSHVDKFTFGRLLDRAESS
ncbi:hypothetical protein DL767_003563 [Monosporascus sp. MG133]|nr:hypothetical protein DL767_003563 [Monosporascus sp. MG133]